MVQKDSLVKAIIEIFSKEPPKSPWVDLVSRKYIFPNILHILNLHFTTLFW